MQEPQQKTDTTCAHRWIIETPNGSKTSRGACRVCGATKRFANAFDDVTEERTRWPRNPKPSVDEAFARLAASGDAA